MAIDMSQIREQRNRQKRLLEKKAQEPYNKQAQYEEWIAWQQQQVAEEARQREEVARAEAEEKSQY